eukprot:3488989-Rhodomonas_salina.2
MRDDVSHDCCKHVHRTRLHRSDAIFGAEMTHVQKSAVTPHACEGPRRRRVQRWWRSWRESGRSACKRWRRARPRCECEGGGGAREREGGPGAGCARRTRKREMGIARKGKRWSGGRREESAAGRASGGEGRGGRFGRVLQAEV